MPANSQAAFLDRLIGPTRSDLPPETARFLLGLDFAESDRDRMRALAAKSQELGDYVEVGHLLALMHSKARRALRQGTLEQAVLDSAKEGKWVKVATAG